MKRLFMSSQRWLGVTTGYTVTSQMKNVQRVQDAGGRLDEIMHHLKVTVDLLNSRWTATVFVLSLLLLSQRVSRFTMIARKQAVHCIRARILRSTLPTLGWCRRHNWAEGPRLLEHANGIPRRSIRPIEAYCGVNMFNKTFCEKHHWLPAVYACSSKRASFCDQSSIGDFPGLKLAYNIKHYAGVNRSLKLHVWYYNQLLKGRDTEAHTKFYNRFGWTGDDLRFGKLTSRTHLKRSTIEWSCWKYSPITG